MSIPLTSQFVTESISELYLKSDLSDVKFAFKHGGPTMLVPAHKLILASGSPVFRTMFFGSLPEKETVEIVDATAEEFKEFLQFFYRTEIKLTMENMEGVTRLADKYDIVDCLNTCAAFMETKLTDANMLWGYQLAVSLDNQKLKEFCESRIASMPADMFKTEGFLNCDKNVLKSILLMDKVSFNEIDIFEACVAWAKAACRKNQLNENNPKSLKKQLGDCIYLIQFGNMTSDDLGAILKNELYSGMFDRNELLEITRTSLVPNFKPKIFKNSSRSKLSFSANKNPEITLERRGHSNGLSYNRYLQATETTWFKSNTSLLLGKIILSLPYADSNNLALYGIEDIDFEIIHHNSNKTIYNGKVNYPGSEVSLVKGIPIKPHEVYAIKVYVPLNWVGNCKHPNIYVNHDSLKINGNAIIQFQKNPNVGQVDTNGLVSALSFKKF